jgi:anti-sigma factor RsiW
VTTNEAKSLFSEYVEGTLDEEEKDQLQAFLASNPDSAAELMQFERTLSIVHRLPMEEPTLDLWAEFAPKMTEYQAEQKTDPIRRLRHKWADLRSSVSEGMILWTHAVAARTHAQLGKYLLRDPLDEVENE